MKKILKILSPLLALLLLLSLCACTAQDIGEIVDTATDIAQAFSEEQAEPNEEQLDNAPAAEGLLNEDGTYTTKDDVALYIHSYGHLPNNFVTKSEAEKAGWSGGSVERYLPGKCIGGDRFGNREGLLPDADGRQWTECDINTLGSSSRGAERIVFSNDGLIYYTGDHYESFQAIYG